MDSCLTNFKDDLPLRARTLGLLPLNKLDLRC